MLVKQITYPDNEFGGYIDNDAILDLNDLFGRLGINKYEKRPNEFYIKNGIKVDKIKYLFQKTKFEEFSDYLICTAWEFRCTLKKSQKRDFEIESYLNNMMILWFLRKNYDLPAKETDKNKINKNIILTLSNFTKQHFNINDKELVELITKYYERIVLGNCLQLDAFEYAKNNTDIYSDLNDFELHKNSYIDKFKDNYINNIKDFDLENRIKVLSKISKSYGVTLKAKDISEFVEVLMCLSAYRKYNKRKLNPTDFNDYMPENYNIVFDYLSLSGILDLIFSEQGKKVKDLKSSPYDYIRSIINNARKRRAINSNKKSYKNLK